MASILAVDDSASMRQLVSLTLKQAGHEVHLAEDGVHALDLADTVVADLVITDIHMPNLDGIGLIKKLRAHRNYQFKPILVLTTESASDMKMKGKEAGATGWIVKPFDPKSLLNVVDKVLTAVVS